MITLTNRQARQFLFIKHGLLGEHAFIGKQGALNYVRQAGCIQYDPVDSCGKNSELVFQSRVKEFTKKTLEELLYIDRKLIDYPDKNLSIIPIEDWPYFARYRNAAKEGGLRFEGLGQLETQAKEYISENGPEAQMICPWMAASTGTQLSIGAAVGTVRPKQHGLYLNSSTPPVS